MFITTHPATCNYDGDYKHMLYEYKKLGLNISFEEYVKQEKEKGVQNPEAMFSETSLIYTPEGLKCPVCNYTQTSFQCRETDKKNFSINSLYKKWLKDTKRSGSVLVGSSIREFLDYAEKEMNKVFFN